MSKAGAFAGLKLTEQVGLDQRLFNNGHAGGGTKQRNNETTLARNNETTKQRDDVQARQRNNETTLERDNGQTLEPTKERMQSQTNRARSSRPRRRTGRFAFPGERLVERHSH